MGLTFTSRSVPCLKKSVKVSENCKCGSPRESYGSYTHAFLMSDFISKVITSDSSVFISQRNNNCLFCPPDIGPEPKPKLKGDNRTFRVWLDPNQYQQDMTSSIQSGTEDPYETFNIIMRRKPKENNFKVCSPLRTSNQLSLYIVSECFIFSPWALVFPTQPQPDVLHILHSLGYWSWKVGARAALKLPPTQGLSNHPNESLFSLDIHVIWLLHLSPLTMS